MSRSSARIAIVLYDDPDAMPPDARAQDIRGVRLTRTLSLVTCPARAPSLSFAARKFLADVCTGTAAPKTGSGLLFRTTLAAVPPWAERACSDPPGNGSADPPRS